MKSDRLNAFVNSFRKFDLNKHIEAQAAFVAENETEPAPLYEMAADGIAQITIRGVMTKYGSSLTGGGTMQMRRAMRDAAADDSVQGILLVVDSPGGTVAGTGDLADDIAATRAKKPIVAFVEDLAASAAYWIASQATKIVASPNSEIGSIGTYARVEDWSAAYEKAGVKVHVIKAGEFKGAGEEGTEITDAQLAEWQQEINGINELFVGAVSKGRGKDASELGWADGKVRRADRALKAGMIDALGTVDTALQELRTMIDDKTKAEDMPMDEEEKDESEEDTTDTEDTGKEEEESKEAAESEAAAASISELRAIGSAEFALACVEAGLTLAQAKVLAEANKAQAGELANLRAKVDRLLSGQEPVTVDAPTTEQVSAIDKLEKQMAAEWAKRHVAGSPASGGFSSFESYRALRIRELTGKEKTK